MGFDFAKAIAEGEKEALTTSLEAIILGQSGAGKSHIIGTLGVKTLYLYTSGETHGVKAAKKEGTKNVCPIAIDYVDGVQLTPDDAYNRVLSLLDDVDGIRKGGFGAIAVDGATELEALIRSTTKWQTLCKSAKGAHNTFEEPRATLTMFRPIINGLKRAQRTMGAHIMMTCILDVKEYGTMNEVVECSPRLLGFSVAESIVQQFGDVLVVGLMKKDDVVKPKLQFMTDVVKTSKSESGVVKKTINFSPRITGLGVEQLPKTMDASLAAVVKLKEQKGEKG
jgi:hypothetical protein